MMEISFGTADDSQINMQISATALRASGNAKR
jgi:hypothetical protein